MAQEQIPILKRYDKLTISTGWTIDSMLQLSGDAALADQVFDLTTAISNTGTTKLQIVPFCTDNQQLQENITRQNHCLFEKK